MASAPLRRLAALALALLASAVPALAQGTIAGTVTDGTFGERLPGANVLVVETATGAATDLDGAFRIARVPAGTYTVRVSFIGFETQTVAGVVVRDGETARLDLVLTTGSLGEVVVEAEAIQATNTEASLLAVQARAPAVLDGISAQQIRRAPDATSGEALRRVTGVTLSGGRFVFVRGVPERYSGTLLNGTPVASTEPDRRAFAFDLIPANLLRSVLVVKTATPDLPGDVAGGVMLLETVDFPEQFTGAVSVSGGVNNATGATLASGPRGGRDFLGVDDGTRQLPDGFPAFNLSSPDVTNVQRGEYGRLLANNWRVGTREGTVAPNVSLSLGGSGQTPVGRLGAVGALSYRSGYSATDVVRREFETADQLRFDYSGTQVGHNVTLGGLLNLAWRPSGLHTVAFKNFLSRTADDETTLLAGQDLGNLDADVRQTALRYVTRTIYSGQLQGEHAFPRVMRGLTASWDLYRASTSRDEPDYRRISYFRPRGAEPDDPYYALVGSGNTIDISNGGRFYSALDEGVWGGAARGTLTLGATRVSAGVSAEDRAREFTSRTFSVVRPAGVQSSQFDFPLLELPIEQIFAPENFGPREDCLSGRPTCFGFVLNEFPAVGAAYDAGQGVTAGFATVDAPVVSRRLRLVGGARVERAVQRVASTRLTGDPFEARQTYLNLLPSANLTYRVTDRVNVRTAYSRTVNRPELRELAPFRYYDFELQTTVYGNDSLRQATINNLDLRVEAFPRAGELLSGSAFYKHFRDPIELAIVPGVALNADRSFINADRAHVYGFELESRVGLGRLAAVLDGSQALVNYTRVFSDVTQPATATSLARSGRPLQGQSSYVVNLGVNLVAPRTGTQLNVLYNRLGSRIIEVASASETTAAGEALDVIEQPRNVVDLTVMQPLLSRYELRLAVRDLLGNPQRFVQGEDLVRENVRVRTVSLGVTARL